MDITEQNVNIHGDSESTKCRLKNISVQAHAITVTTVSLPVTLCFKRRNSG